MAGKIEKKQPHPQALIHPEMAAGYGINGNDEITIETPCGRITQTARLTNTVHSWGIYAAHGW